MGGILDVITGQSGKDAATASNEAARLAAGGQRESLDYLKEVEALPLEMRNKFLPQLADIYSGGQGQQDLINSAMNSPLYKAIMGGRAVGEDAIMRNASMTGGMRSGNVSADLTDYGSQLSNQALMQSYNQQLQGIQGLAGIGLNTNAIANATAAPSSTLAQGKVAGAQAIQQGNEALTSNVMGLAGAALMAPKGTFSDIRLKDDIQYEGKKNGHNIYSWTWRPEAEELGLEGISVGVLAHEVYEYAPEAISTDDGLLMVDYSQLGLEAA